MLKILLKKQFFLKLFNNKPFAANLNIVIFYYSEVIENYWLT